jgi:hypothetical protein
MMASARWLAHNSFGIFIESDNVRTTLDTGC